MLGAKTQYTTLEIELATMFTITLAWLVWLKDRGIVIPSSDKLLPDMREYNRVIVSSITKQSPNFPQTVMDAVMDQHL